MERIYISETPKRINEKVQLKGWVNARRDHGKVIFIDIRDRSGLAQVVFVPGNPSYETAKDLRSEYVVSLTGQINKRPDKMINEKIPTGSIEILAEDIQILNTAKTPPFEISGNTAGINEETRLKYRYLDLRTDRMKNIVILRHKIEAFFFNWLSEHDFLNIETPNLTKGTPEGAREFVIPSRLHPGEFYVLPQSPQQFKQLLMVAGMERYFQIARCFRDEDQRGDRQPEFYPIGY
jgi:aspartyl-tRNA synthetase